MKELLIISKNKLKKKQTENIVINQNDKRNKYFIKKK